ncbi:MAG: transposase [Cytophagales bacterium]|nr:transposase [Cytophagales bacterium]
MVYFFEFKPYTLINDKVGLLNFVVTDHNTDDRAPLKTKPLSKL